MLMQPRSQRWNDRKRKKCTWNIGFPLLLRMHQKDRIAWADVSTLFTMLHKLMHVILSSYFLCPGRIYDKEVSLSSNQKIRRKIRLSDLVELCGCLNDVLWHLSKVYMWCFCDISVGWALILKHWTTKLPDGRPNIYWSKLY